MMRLTGGGFDVDLVACKLFKCRWVDFVSEAEGFGGVHLGVGEQLIAEFGVCFGCTSFGELGIAAPKLTLTASARKRAVSVLVLMMVLGGEFDIFIPTR